MIQPVHFAYFEKNDCFENRTVDDVSCFLDETENSLDCAGNWNSLSCFENWNSLVV